MNASLTKKVVLALGASLLLAGCGDIPRDAPAGTETQPSAMPEVLPDTLKIKQHKKTYVITGIGLGGSNRVAIINNQVVKQGMEIDPGVMLEDVQPTYAIILAGNTKHLLRPESIQSELDKKKR